MSLELLVQLGQRFQGVNLQFRRDGTAWPKRWRAECFSAKHEEARYYTFGDTADEAIQALVATVHERMQDEPSHIDAVLDTIGRRVAGDSVPICCKVCMRTAMRVSYDKCGAFPVPKPHLRYACEHLQADPTNHWPIPDQAVG